MAAEAQLGSAALSAKDYTAAITHLSNALSTSPTSPDYLISRSTAYQRAGQSERALKDAEAAVHYAHRRGKREAIGSAQMRRAIALYGLKRFSDAKKCFDWAKDKNEKEPGLPSWTVKVEREIAKLDEERRSEVTVVEIPEEPKEEEEAQELVGRDAETKEEEEKTDQAKTADGGAGDHTKKQPEGVQTPANKIRHEWYQTTDTVVITLLAKGVPKDKATIDIQERSVSGNYTRFDLIRRISDISPGINLLPSPRISHIRLLPRTAICSHRHHRIKDINHVHQDRTRSQEGRPRSEMAFSGRKSRKPLALQLHLSSVHNCSNPYKLRNESTSIPDLLPHRPKELG